MADSWEPGLDKIRAGTCPVHAQSPMACMLCPYGHLTECHFPLSCAEAECSHLARYDEADA